MYVNLIILVFILSINAYSKITYDDHIRNIFKADCYECHNPDKAKGGLDLSSYAQTMAGSSSGKILESGNPEDSILFECITTDDSDIRMPPKGGRMAKNDIEIIKSWITGGLLENRNSKKKIVIKTNNFSIGEIKKGDVIMPEDLSLVPFHFYQRLGAVKQMAASPYSPLCAIAFYKQIALYKIDSKELLGYLNFAEGDINDLSFSEDGRYLLAAGGHIANHGHVVIWDVQTGERIFHLNHQDMDIHSAHLSPDMKYLAIGSRDKKVKFYDLSTKELIYEEKAHSEWISRLRFSPDGKYLMSGDRNGQLIIWDAIELSRLHTIYKHKASVTSVAWRPDSKICVSAGMDGAIYFFDPIKGTEQKNIKTHKSGVYSLSYNNKVQLCSTGKDNHVRIFDSSYKQIEVLNCGKAIPLSAICFQDHIISTSYGGMLMSKKFKSNEDSAFFMIPRTLTKQAEKQSSPNNFIKSEKLNHSRHLLLAEKFKLKEKKNKLILEQLYLKEEIKTALEKKMSIIELNKLYLDNINLHNQSKEISDKITAINNKNHKMINEVNHLRSITEKVTLK